ncbi:MAG: hypothetical protein NZP74_13790 [Anaerolineales bacterium]|nr:hypothetical protein [Anaerolineales bacterium]MDW8279435.1 hypothetical protein [Anaerolineales bacterium]
MPKPPAFTRYGLSLEELALALGLVNRPDLGRSLLNSIYPELSETEAEARLSAASHSLLARNLCTISPQGQPILDSALEKTLFPLIRFDRLYQISVVFGELQTNAAVYVRKGNIFTARTVQAGVAHILDTGSSSLLSDYFSEMFAEASGKTSLNISAPITPGLLGRALQQVASRSDCVALLSDAGWLPETARQLCDDLSHQTLRATLLCIEATETDLEEKLRTSQHRVLMLLKGKTRGWGFLFENTLDETIGQAWQVNARGLNQLFAKFTAA